MGRNNPRQDKGQDCPPDNGGGGGTTVKEQCAIELTGFVECCCNGGEPGEPTNKCNKFLRQPCTVDADALIVAIQQFQAVPANAGYTVVQIVDNGRNGWTVVFVGPCKVV
jgi:hypothetical protein